MTRLEQAKNVMHAIGAFITAIGGSDRPTSNGESVLRVLDDQLAQREDIFAFGVLERVYDRGLGQLESVTNRIGVLIAAQVAIEAVLIDKIDEFGRGPGLLVFGVIIASGLLFRASGEADFVEADTFMRAFGDSPRETRDALMARLPAAIARNAKIAGSRRNLFSAALTLTIAAVGWALAANLLHFGVKP